MCIRDSSKVTITDQESEWEICNEKWEELRELARCVESLEAGPGRSIAVSYTHLGTGKITVKKVFVFYVKYI